MRIFVVLFLLLLSFFATAFLVVRVVWKAVRSVLEGAEKIFTGKIPESGGRGRKKQQEQVIINVTPNAPMPVHRYTDEEKQQMAARAISTALANTSGEEPHDALVRLSRIARDSKDKREQPELARIRQTSVELYSVFKKDRTHYGYTYSRLAQCIGGINELAGKDGQSETITGMMYATEIIRAYVKNLQEMAEISDSSDTPELAEEISDLMERAERLYWLFLAYPDASGRNSDVVNNMLDSVTGKLKVFIKVKDYDVDNREVTSLLDKSLTTLREMNVALDTVLNNVLSRDMLQADVELETLRQEMRLRGLY